MEAAGSKAARRAERPDRLGFLFSHFLKRTPGAPPFSSDKLDTGGFQGRSPVFVALA
jgi:hypothetical protein